jgi:hypothetical protein
MISLIDGPYEMTYSLPEIVLLSPSREGYKKVTTVFARTHIRSALQSATMKAIHILISFAMFGAALADPHSNLCKIVGDYDANCRLGTCTDDTLCPIVVRLPVGNTYTFNCRQIGDPVDGDK